MKVRFGFIGSGFIAEFQAKAMQQLPDVELTAILQRTGAEKLSAWSQNVGLGPAKLCQSVAEVCQDVDIVAVYSPNYTKVAVMEEIAAAKKAGASVEGVIVDKPMGRNVKEARRIAELAKEAGLLNYYFENQLFMKAIQAQRAQLRPQQEQMGPLTLTRSAEEHGGPHQAWFWDPTRQGGGVLCDMGCHSIAVGWYALTPQGKPLTFLRPRHVTCQLALLKWGQPKWKQKLIDTFDVDYGATPAEDFATGTITYENPETQQTVVAQFTNSWMFEKQGLRLFMDGTGPGYAFEVNTLQSPLNIFIGDEAADAIADSELALEKSTASRGLLSVQTNEADLYGYVDENQDAVAQFKKKQNGYLDFGYGVEVIRLVMAAYMASERGRQIDLADPEVIEELESYIPLIQQGKGADVLGSY